MIKTIAFLLSLVTTLIILYALFAADKHFGGWVWGIVLIPWLAWWLQTVKAKP